MQTVPPAVQSADRRSTVLLVQWSSYRQSIKIKPAHCFGLSAAGSRPTATGSRQQFAAGFAAANLIRPISRFVSRFTDLSNLSNLSS